MLTAATAQTSELSAAEAFLAKVEQSEPGFPSLVRELGVYLQVVRHEDQSKTVSTATPRPRHRLWCVADQMLEQGRGAGACGCRRCSLCQRRRREDTDQTLVQRAAFVVLYSAMLRNPFLSPEKITTYVQEVAAAAAATASTSSTSTSTEGNVTTTARLAQDVVEAELADGVQRSVIQHMLDELVIPLFFEPLEKHQNKVMSLAAQQKEAMARAMLRQVIDTADGLSTPSYVPASTLLSMLQTGHGTARQRRHGVNQSQNQSDGPARMDSGPDRHREMAPCLFVDDERTIVHRAAGRQLHCQLRRVLFFRQAVDDSVSKVAATFLRPLRQYVQDVECLETVAWAVCVEDPLEEAAGHDADGGGMSCDKEEAQHRHRVISEVISHFLLQCHDDGKCDVFVGLHPWLLARLAHYDATFCRRLIDELVADRLKRNVARWPDQHDGAVLASVRVTCLYLLRQRGGDAAECTLRALHEFRQANLDLLNHHADLNRRELFGWLGC